MSTINKFALLRLILSDIDTLEAWISVKEADLRIPPGQPRHIRTGSPTRGQLRADIADRKRQLHILKTMNGLGNKL